MATTATTATTVFLLIAFAALVSGTRAESVKKYVYITNNHTNYLSLRCFSFDNFFNVVHLAPWGMYRISVVRRVVFPSSTMFNCSTNMGTFVAYRYDYECTARDDTDCQWRFDQENAYLWNPKNSSWVMYDYAPNYESLDRGGVIKGYYAN